MFFAGSIESAYWLLLGGHIVFWEQGRGAFGSFMISRPRLSCIHWLEFVYRMLWHHFGRHLDATMSRGSIWTVLMTSFFWFGIFSLYWYLYLNYEILTGILYCDWDVSFLTYYKNVHEDGNTAKLRDVLTFVLIKYFAVLWSL